MTRRGTDRAESPCDRHSGEPPDTDSLLGSGSAQRVGLRGGLEALSSFVPRRDARSPPVAAWRDWSLRCVQVGARGSATAEVALVVADGLEDVELWVPRGAPVRPLFFGIVPVPGGTAQVRGPNPRAQPSPPGPSSDPELRA